MYILFLGGNKMETYNRDLHTHTVKEYEVKRIQQHVTFH